MTQIIALCGLCGGHHDTFECAVQRGVLALQDHFAFGDTTPVLIGFLVEQGWPRLISTDAALRHAVTNDDWPLPPRGAA